MNLKFTLSAGLLCCLVGCTTGQLQYITPEGESKIACEVEYSWAPSVDKYAVEYVLAYCAKKFANKGNTVVRTELLDLDLTVPKPPENQIWTWELATEKYKNGELTDKEYGYLVAYIDLGLNKEPAQNK